MLAEIRTERGAFTGPRIKTIIKDAPPPAQAPPASYVAPTTALPAAPDAVPAMGSGRSP